MHVSLYLSFEAPLQLRQHQSGRIRWLEMTVASVPCRPGEHASDTWRILSHWVRLVVKWGHCRLMKVAKHPLDHLSSQSRHRLPLKCEVQHSSIKVASLNCLQAQKGVRWLINRCEDRVVAAVPVPAQCPQAYHLKVN